MAPALARRHVGSAARRAAPTPSALQARGLVSALCRGSLQSAQTEHIDGVYEALRSVKGVYLTASQAETSPAALWDAAAGERCVLVLGRSAG